MTTCYTKAMMGLSIQLPRRQCFSWDLRKGQNFTELVQVLVKKRVRGNFRQCRKHTASMCQKESPRSLGITRVCLWISVPRAQKSVPWGPCRIPFLSVKRWPIWRINKRSHGREDAQVTKTCMCTFQGEKSISVYKCAKESQIPYTTLLEIVRGKTKIENWTYPS